MQTDRIPSASLFFKWNRNVCPSVAQQNSGSQDLLGGKAVVFVCAGLVLLRTQSNDTTSNNKNLDSWEADKQLV